MRRGAEEASPAARLVTGLRLYQDVARRFPLFARFVTRVGPRAAGPESLVYAYLPIHITEGVKRGEFVDAPVLISLDLIVGASLIAVARISTGEADQDYLRALMLALMRSLGLATDRAEALVAQPLAPLDLDKDSLFVRSQARFQKQKKR